MRPEVVNVRTFKGPCIYVGRKMPGRAGHPLGNPFKLPKKHTQADREECLELYRAWLKEKGFDMQLADLASRVQRTGLPLGCWCHPELCHAHVLAEEVEKILAARNTQES